MVVFRYVIETEAGQFRVRKYLPCMSFSLLPYALLGQSSYSSVFMMALYCYVGMHRVISITLFLIAIAVVEQIIIVVEHIPRHTTRVRISERKEPLATIALLLS
jgi:hypothetical protein